MSVKLLTEHYLDYLSVKAGYTGSSESTLVKMPHCWNHMPWLIADDSHEILGLIFFINENSCLESHLLKHRFG